MKKFNVISGNMDIWTDEFMDLADATMEIKTIYEKLSKSEKKELENENYKLYIEIIDLNDKLENESDIEECALFGSHNLDGFKIIDTIDWTEIV